MSNRILLKDRPLFWDAQIAALLIGPVLAAAWMLSHVPTLVEQIISTVLMIGSLTVFYGSFIEPNLLLLNKKVIRIKGLPFVKIAIMADQHVGPYKKGDFIRKAVNLTQKQKADIIVLPGDFLFDHLSDINHLDALKELKAPLGVYAVIGNHDSGRHEIQHLFKPGTPYAMPDRSDEVTDYLRARGITVLRNESVMLKKDGINFALAGADDIWTDTMDLHKTFSDIPKATPVILLAHNPDVILHKEHARASLIISGHTHGGQIRLPVIGLLAGVPTKLGRRYDRGIFPLKNGCTLAITQGMGETMARARLCCPPEIMTLEVIHEESDEEEDEED
jgi:predicted MPP superfamily phosphohydrolase